MAQAPTGPQYVIRPWAVSLELLAYLASQGLGTYVSTATTGNTLFLNRMPDTPVVACSLNPDPSPAPRSGLSRPHFTLYIRDTTVASGGARAALAFEALHQKSLPLTSYFLYSECDGLPSAFTFNQNNFPVHVLNITTSGMVKRA